MSTSAPFTAAPPRVCCIGGANIDRVLRLKAPGLLGTSNPAATQTAFGGVARNVASNLARLGLRAGLVARVGGDADGQALLADAEALGIDTGLCARAEGVGTGAYTAVLEPGGELLIGVADTEACEGLTPSFLTDCWAEILAASLVFADANLPAETLEALRLGLRDRGGRLALDAVSVAKARRLPADLSGVELVFCNIEEARVLIEEESGGAAELARALQVRGAEVALVTDGPKGLACASAEGLLSLPAEPARVVDVSGAGDALIAGVIYGRLRGWDLDSACRAGLRAARLTVETLGSGSVALTPDALDLATEAPK